MSHTGQGWFLRGGEGHDDPRSACFTGTEFQRAAVGLHHLPDHRQAQPETLHVRVAAHERLRFSSTLASRLASPGTRPS